MFALSYIYVSETRFSFFDLDANRVIINAKGNNECLQCWYLRSGGDYFWKCKCHLRMKRAHFHIFIPAAGEQRRDLA